MDLLKQLKESNAERCKFFGHELSDWSLCMWSNAIAGEVGELCHLVKKKYRGDGGITTETMSEEAADIVIYLDLFCQRAGIDLSKAIIDKFNKTSRRIEVAQNGADNIPRLKAFEVVARDAGGDIFTQALTGLIEVAKERIGRVEDDTAIAEKERENDILRANNTSMQHTIQKLERRIDKLQPPKKATPRK